MSSVDKQILFSAYEVASLYVYDVLFPDHSDFDWYLRENHVNQKDDVYAHLEISKNHDIYEKMIKDLLHSISKKSFCIDPAANYLQQFPRKFLFKWFKEQGLECPGACLPAKNTDQDEYEGLSAGAVDYLNKPFRTVVDMQRLAIHIKLYRKYNTAANTENLVAKMQPNERFFGLEHEIKEIYKFTDAESN